MISGRLAESVITKTDTGRAVVRHRYWSADHSEPVFLINFIGVRTERVVIVAEQTVVAEHVRATERDRVIYDWRHYLPLIERKPGALRNGAPFTDLPAPLQQLRQALLKRAGGDRVMAQVLSAVPRFGLEALLVAVELALESGRPSAEQVLNLLARLHEGPPPQRVETALTVDNAPLADASRYDRLRVEAGHD